MGRPIGGSKMANYEIEIKKYHFEGIGYSAIARRIGVDPSSVLNYCKKIGIEFEKPIDLNKYMDDIIAMRDQKYSIRNIAKKYNVHHGTVSRALKDHDQSTSMFRHEFDRDFFKVIDTEAKAYFLGIMMSDGGIKEDGICINMTDRDTIQKFKLATHYSGDIRVLMQDNPKHKTKYEVNLYSVEMMKDLEKYGVIPNKSLILKFPPIELIPEWLRHHLVRGIFDGDGGLTFDKVNNQWAVVFTGTKEVLSSIEKISNINGKYDYISTSNNNTWQWRIRAQLDIIKFICWIYYDSNIFMDRKKTQCGKCLIDLKSRKLWLENKN